MSKMLKLAMAAVIAFTYGSAYAQAARTGANVLYAPGAVPNNTGPGDNKWLSGVAGTTDAWTGTFHAGGVAACDGCHVMHNANNGVARSTVVAPWTNAVPAFLLQGSDQSSTCLICHGGAGSAAGTGRNFVITNTNPALATAQMNYTPGGDFGWLKIKGASEPTSEARHGHNIVALDFGFSADALTKAPGGTFTASASGVSAFACSNCHDPHGRYRMQLTGGTSWEWAGPTGGLPAITQPIYSSGSYGVPPTTMNGTDVAVGSYRLLAGRGYSPASAGTSAYPFPNNPPVAVAPLTYNKSEVNSGPALTRAANEVRVAYGSGMSEWCQNCHTNIHLDNYVSGAMGASGLRHPAGQGAVLKPGQYNVYNTYVSSGKTGSGDLYTSLVPYENNGKVTYSGSTGSTTDLANLSAAANNTSDPAGIFTANGQSNVMCLSCHRAHASAFSSMVRWNADDTFITNASAMVDSQGRGDAALRAGYYGRQAGDLGVFQRSLCNKCHGKD